MFGHKHLLLKVKTERFEYFQFYRESAVSLEKTLCIFPPRSVLHFELLLFSTQSCTVNEMHEKNWGAEGRGGNGDHLRVRFDHLGIISRVVQYSDILVSAWCE